MFERGRSSVTEVTQARRSGGAGWSDAAL